MTADIAKGEVSTVQGLADQVAITPNAKANAVFGLPDQVAIVPRFSTGVTSGAVPNGAGLFALNVTVIELPMGSLKAQYLEG